MRCTRRTCHIWTGCAGTPNAVEVVLRRTNETTCDDITSADAIIMGSPVYMGSMAAAVKGLLEGIQDCIGYPSDAMLNKVGGAFATGGQVSAGKDETRTGILLAMTGVRMVITGSDVDAFGAQATHPNGAATVNFTAQEI